MATFYTGQPSITDTLLYTAAQLGAKIKSITVTNATGTAVSITLETDSGSVLNTVDPMWNLLFIPANSTYYWKGKEILGCNETIRAKQGTVGALTVTIEGSVPNDFGVLSSSKWLDY